jgi:ADP-heptose:LPS heptosyltransferase
VAASFLKKWLGGEGTDPNQTTPFTLPGALHAGARVLVVDSGDPTDLLFLVPLLEEIKNSVPRAELGCICDERMSFLALSCDLFDDVVVLDDEQLLKDERPGPALKSALAREPWDVALLAGSQPDRLREELALASGAVLRLGPGHPQAYPRINCEVRSKPGAAYPYHRTETWSRLLGLDPRHRPLRWPLSDKRLRQSAQLVHFNKPRKDQILVGVDPAVGKGGAAPKAANMAYVVNHIVQHIPSKVMILSAQDEDPRAQELDGALRGERLDLPQPTLLERVMLLAQCQLFVAGNTDLLHFAAARSVPTLALFTPADSEGWVPHEAQNFEVVRLQPHAELDLADLMERVRRLLG